ncbi:dipeptidyl aminopeptidase/acylaminoacyl peptidase [Shimia isoporae]|uniref:Dipeptidyl aminopeptidase/acylaminoacyl peptidase n=1 Tax=Shimia isoporae TaxID=647720 RepID=A0A4R1N3W2_9RHOB|nr:prolyl oligopeptidase family serine peptidase [Shimia isoporae]TCL00365.1 dipeptidyl aminopeptidase/acylaminoacyl peptidase [Shimia isoporae]
MTDKTTEKYGAWASPIAPQALVAGVKKFEQIQLDDLDIYWVEGRPDEGGRSVVVRAAQGEIVSDVTPLGYNARSLVNSYGGGAMSVQAGTVWFTNFASKDFPDTHDQRIYALRDGQFPQPVTPRQDARFSDMVPDHDRGLIYAVQERGDTKLHGQAQQTLVALDMNGKALPLTIAEGSDFYAAPALSPDGRQLAWITWDYPSMPWDGTRLQLADIDEAGNARNIRTIGGAPAKHVDPALNPVLQNALRYSDEAIAEPRWGPDGTLYCVSDRLEIDGTRWSNLHRVDGESLTAITRVAGDFTSPLWRLGVSSYGFISDQKALCAFTSDGVWSLAVVDLTSGNMTSVDLPYTAISQLKVGDGFAAFVGGRFDGPSAIVRLDTGDFSFHELQSASPDMDAKVRACLVAPETISFDVENPDGSTARSHAFYHAPSNPGFEGPADERPPLVIVIHGGPSASASAAASLDIAFFTSRGFAVLDTNYRGSTGFGRAYRQSLYGEWGVVDVADCVAGANYLVAQDKVDRYRIVSRGGSAGGYTTLALATFANLLSAGASYYGISDLQMIAQDTDKLEAYYAPLLVGPWPEAQKIYKARSPLFHADEISCPLIIFQGLDDPVVPPPQAHVLIDTMVKRKLPVAWEFYKGEGHGFRQSAHITGSLEEELSFYGSVLGFTPAGHLKQPDIKNWPLGDEGND